MSNTGLLAVNGIWFTALLEVFKQLPTKTKHVRAGQTTSYATKIHEKFCVLNLSKKPNANKFVYTCNSE